MRTIKDTFEEYYESYEEPCNNKKGFRIAYRYVGPWYVYNVEKEQLRRYKRIFGMACVFGTASFFAAALQDCPLNYVTYPMLFAMLSFAALLFEWVGVVWFLAAKEKMTKYSFDELHMIIKIATAVHAGLLFLAAVAGVWMIISERLAAGIVLVPVLYLVSGMFSFMIFRLYGKLPFERRENEGGRKRK